MCCTEHFVLIIFAKLTAKSTFSRNYRWEIQEGEVKLQESGIPFPSEESSFSFDATKRSDKNTNKRQLAWKDLDTEMRQRWRLFYRLIS